MFPLKLLHSLVSGHNLTKNPLFLTQTHHFSNHDEIDNDQTIPTKPSNKTPFMIFTPTQELVKDTYRLATIARAMGMDLQPNPSLSHIIFSWPSPSSPNDTVPLPFPSFTTSSLSHLRLFAHLTKGYFKLAFLQNNISPCRKIESLSNYNWHCTSLSLFSTRSGEKIESMDGFSKALLGMGWTLFRTNTGSNKDSIRTTIYLYRKLDVSRICNAKQVPNGNVVCSRVRELRLPLLDFRNAPLRILQYILLMTDDIFSLA